MAQFGVSWSLCCRLGRCAARGLGIWWQAGLPRELAGGCSTHHTWSGRFGHGSGVTSRGIHVAWHTTARCVQPLRQWAPIRACSNERSSDVFRRHLWPSPVASLRATFSFNYLQSHRPRAMRLALPGPKPGVRPSMRGPGTPTRRIPSTPPWLKNKEGSPSAGLAGFRSCPDHASVLIGQFSCAAVAQSASSWGQARLGAVKNAPCRTTAAKLGRRMPDRLLEAA
ncbi:hypothetical protein F5144DRAFT_257113 [Chaetomium tenue]|uniref:Uncharacterized protein n=1 Tax=Chaetomium tenue TaxID=1854479 RepID=A0ACB7PBX4_9PEZI|nr:hypothetical protein F5144DRAFT_257113 [Chaetomium globosum]